MELIQIGETKQAPATSTVTILEMFQQLADREARMIRELRSKAGDNARAASRMSNS